MGQTGNGQTGKFIFQTRQVRKMEMLIDDCIANDQQALSTGGPGSGKTTTSAHTAVHIATGTKLWGNNLNKGSVVILHEEAQVGQVLTYIKRFYLGLTGKQTDFDLEAHTEIEPETVVYLCRDLDITVIHQMAFQYGRKGKCEQLLKLIGLGTKTSVVMIDSLTTTLPYGKFGIDITEPKLGMVIKNTHSSIMGYTGRPVWLNTHAKKDVLNNASVDQIQNFMSMETAVLGSTTIVSEGCDVGFMHKRISDYSENPDGSIKTPTRFAIIVKARHSAVKASIKPLILEVKEQSYGIGSADLNEVPETVIPPTQVEKMLAQFFAKNDLTPFKQRRIVNETALFSRDERKQSLDILLKRKVIITDPGDPCSFIFNPNASKVCDHTYWKALGI